MALRMVASNRAADGRWFARKGIPQDVRKEYARLYGVSREAHLKLPADASRHEAKTRLGEWEAEIETRIATLRALQKGEGQPLTKLNAIAGRWYTWFVGQHENDDDVPDSFPVFTNGHTRGTGVSCRELFETFVKATKPADNTV
jgi:hypothetical protein